MRAQRQKALRHVEGACALSTELLCEGAGCEGAKADGARALSTELLREGPCCEGAEADGARALCALRALL